MNRSKLRKLAFELQATDAKNLVAVAGILDSIKNYLSKMTRGFFFEERFRFQQSNETLKAHIGNMQSILKELDSSIQESNFNDYLHHLTVLKSEMQEILKWMTQHRSEIKTVQDSAKDQMNAQVSALPPEKKEELKQELQEIKKSPDAPSSSAEPAVFDPKNMPADWPKSQWAHKVKAPVSETDPSNWAESEKNRPAGLNDFLNRVKSWSELNGQTLGASSAFSGVNASLIHVSDEIISSLRKHLKNKFSKNINFLEKATFTDKATFINAIRNAVFNGSMQRWSLQHQYKGDPGGRVYVIMNTDDLFKISGRKLNKQIKLQLYCRYNSHHDRIEVTFVAPQIHIVGEDDTKTKSESKKTKTVKAPEPVSEILEPEAESPAFVSVPMKSNESGVEEVKKAFDYYVNNSWFKKTASKPQTRYLIEIFGRDPLLSAEFAYLLKVALRHNFKVIAHVHTNGNSFEVAVPAVAATEEEIISLGREINRELTKVTNSFAQFSVTSSNFPKFAQLDLDRSEQYSRMFTLAYTKKVG